MAQEFTMRRDAIVLDEVHSNHTGETMLKMKSVLCAAMLTSDDDLQDRCRTAACLIGSIARFGSSVGRQVHGP